MPELGNPARAQGTETGGGEMMVMRHGGSSFPSRDEKDSPWAIAIALAAFLLMIFAIVSTFFMGGPETKTAPDLQVREVWTPRIRDK